MATQEKLLLLPHKPPPGQKFVLVVHGGAGTISRATSTPERQASYKAALKTALEAGHAILREGGEAMDAAVAAVTALESRCFHQLSRDTPVIPSLRLSTLQRGQGSCLQYCWRGAACSRADFNGITHLLNTERARVFDHAIQTAGVPPRRAIYETGVCINSTHPDEEPIPTSPGSLPFPRDCSSRDVIWTRSRIHW